MAEQTTEEKIFHHLGVTLELDSKDPLFTEYFLKAMGELHLIEQ